MSKGEQTREMILHQAAQLFNRRGFYGSAMSDVMEATGMEKGGLYNHFKSKEDLAIQAFDYAIDLKRQEFVKVIQNNANTVDRLTESIAIFQNSAEGYPIPGGCPVMNTAIESDDTHPVLREKARVAMDEWHQFVRKTVQRGKEKGEIRTELDAEMFSSIFISVLEGAIMQSKLYGNMRHMNRAVEYLQGYIEREVRAK